MRPTSFWQTKMFKIHQNFLFYRCWNLNMMNTFHKDNKSSDDKLKEDGIKCVSMVTGGWFECDGTTDVRTSGSHQWKLHKQIPEHQPGFKKEDSCETLLRVQMLLLLLKNTEVKSCSDCEDLQNEWNLKKTRFMRTKLSLVQVMLSNGLKSK